MSKQTNNQINKEGWAEKLPGGNSNNNKVQQFPCMSKWRKTRILPTIITFSNFLPFFTRYSPVPSPSYHVSSLHLVLHFFLPSLASPLPSSAATSAKEFYTDESYYILLSDPGAGRTYRRIFKQETHHLFSTILYEEHLTLLAAPRRPVLSLTFWQEWNEYCTY